MMRISPTPASWAMLLLLTTALLVSGCSRFNLAYRNLDLIAAWHLDDYLDMNREQRRFLRTEVRDHLAWHCEHQLPHDLATLRTLQQQVHAGMLDAPILAEHYRDLQAAIGKLTERVTPSGIELLRSLDDHQVQHLATTMAEQHREHQAQYLSGSMQDQIRERAERMSERIEFWTGHLSAQQRQRILAWSHGLGEQNRLWLENRQRWQAELLEALQQRNDPSLEERLRHLLQDGDSLVSDTYRSLRARNEAATLALLAELFQLADVSQRRHLEGRLQALSDDLASLDCLPEPSDAIMASHH